MTTTMKRASYLLAFVAAAILALAMVVPAKAFADGDTTAVTINSANQETGSVYKGYKLMTAVPDNAASPTKYTYTVNPTYKSAVLTALGLASTATDKDIYDAIADLDDDGIEAFADAMFEALGSEGGDATLNEGTAANLEYGYWLIYEQTAGTLPNDQGAGTYSKVLLDTYAQSPAVTVTTKESFPTPDKEIVDSSLDSDSDTVAVGDTVTYKISATLPANLAKYETYKLVFTDEMGAGLTFKSISSIKIDGQDAATTNITTNNAATIADTAGATLNVGWDNIKLDSHAAASKVVEITYTCEVNDDAVIGSEGNPNTVKIEYSNNPYTDGTGESTEIENKVYTFKLTVNKVDDQGQPLEGAGFTLYKADGTQVGEEITGVTTFEWERLDAGAYKIVETTVPNGYTKADDIEFTISAEEVEADDSITVSAEGITLDSTSYIASTDVVNQSGTVLPSTGGMGTTILYTIGAILALGAVIFLVTRRRVAKATEAEVSDDVM